MRLIRVTGAALLLTAVLAGPVLAGAPILADLSVVKTDSPDPVAAGSNITYTITVQNLGPGTADFVCMCDVIPAGTTFVSAVEPAGWTESFFTGQLCEETPTLTAAAGPQVMTVIVQVDPYCGRRHGHHQHRGSVKRDVRPQPGEQRSDNNNDRRRAATHPGSQPGGCRHAAARCREPTRAPGLRRPPDRGAQRVGRRGSPASPNLT